ncbi:proteasome subunit alpha type-7-1-like [Drosophila serrata]|uniref:proteasome subunit alpha type-7-1-like n=1 Tax=Drosophila serrata TaxID=7274 RepID=UPI000A1CFC6F|nr:proteasome subunit alpha type-7-1-like [Drosophila serrata]KAH8374164.1 hypothetical protein KR200_006469 [Drosophila serrata]
MRPRCNKPVTLFSPGGRLLQVEYAQNGVQKGSTAVGIRCYNCVVLALEQKELMPQQMEHTTERIFSLDKNMIMSYAGISPDARVLVARARAKCQKLRALNDEDPVSVRLITEYLANLKLKYTQAPDCRPFGVSCLIGGYDANVKARLYQTDPYGNYSEYIATAIGRSAQTALAYLEKGYATSFLPSRHRAIKLAIGALLSVSHPERREFEVVLLKRNNQLVKLEQDVIAEYVANMDEYMG